MRMKLHVYEAPSTCLRPGKAAGRRRSGVQVSSHPSRLMLCRLESSQAASRSSHITQRANEGHQGERFASNQGCKAQNALLAGLTVFDVVQRPVRRNDKGSAGVRLIKHKSALQPKHKVLDRATCRNGMQLKGQKRRVTVVSDSRRKRCVRPCRASRSSRASPLERHSP